MNSYFLRYQSSGSGSGNDIPRRGSGVVKWERVENNTGLDLTVCKLRVFNSYEMYVGKELCASVKQGIIKIGDANVKNGVIGGIRPSWENHGRDGFILFKQTGLLSQGKLMIGTDCAGMTSSHGGLLDF